MTRLLVTGAYGFVGRHVARAAAAAGYSVHGLGHGSWGRAEWREWGISEWHTASITLETLVSHGAEPDVIIHCAGSGSVAFSMMHPAQDFERSVVTTREVLEYARLHRPGAMVVLPSSAAVYGDVGELPIRVDTPSHPASPYGVHKKFSEDLGRSYARHFAINVAIVRLFSVYGIGLRKQLIWDACTKLSRGESHFGGTGEETRDWLHVDDAATLLLAAAAIASPRAPLVNGASGEGITIRTVVETIAQALPHTPDFAFSGQRRPGDPPHYVACIDEAEALGWQPSRDLVFELRDYVRWFLDHAP